MIYKMRVCKAARDIGTKPKDKEERKCWKRLREACFKEKCVFRTVAGRQPDELTSQPRSSIPLPLLLNQSEARDKKGCGMSSPLRQ